MFKKISAGLAGLFVAGAALAVPPDYTTLTTAVDFSTVTSSLMTVAAAVVGVYITWAGAKKILAAIRGA